MSEMVERVAKALYERMANDGMTVMDARECARAAIASMREPTDAMMSAGIDRISIIAVGSVRPTWRAMIDAALQPEPRPATAGDV